jgi:hypothetical protein
MVANMKPNTFSLDSELAASLGECEVGETKTITLEITVDKMDDSGLSGTVNSASYSEPEEETPPEPAMPKRPKAVEKALKY